MKNCAFTIVAKNYIGLARILESSIKQYYTEFDFFIMVADEISDDIRQEFPSNVLIAKECIGIEEEQWQNMSFKYDLTEFCTSIKPISCLYFFGNYDYDNVIYLDPDIYFFDSIGKIYDELNNCCVMLTPHLTQMMPVGITDSPESVWHSCGMFNLGFCGLHRADKTMRMLNWWHERLINQCFNDPYSALFTDQKWMDFIPCFFSSNELLISFHLGMNMAPWNFCERKVAENNGKFYVSPRLSVDTTYPLIFVHYSGYNYAMLKKGKVCQNNIDGIRDYEDIKLLSAVYSEAISKDAEVFDSFITLQYSYNQFEDGSNILKMHRRLYRALCDRGELFDNPFCTEGKFYKLLRKSGFLSKVNVYTDKMTRKTAPGVSNKLVVFNRLTRFLFNFLGFERYMLLIRLFRPYSRFESQIHLVDKKYMSNNIL